jgi:hypothetical protein
MINNITEFKVIDKEFGYGTEIGDKFTWDSKNKVYKHESNSGESTKDYTYTTRSEIILSDSIIGSNVPYIEVVKRLPNSTQEKSKVNKIEEKIHDRIAKYNNAINDLIDEEEYNPFRDSKVNVYANIVKELNTLLDYIK